ncbi:amidohydrolase family protein [Streptomyces fimicarius]|uniref:amidohydrolase family protein n=1 Tax=Streptomyces griseus TaxID=1911 RepID=UPI0036C27832
MAASLSIDVHTHYFGTDMAQLREGAQGPRLVVDTPAAGRLMRGTSLFREVRSELWDVDRRLDEMDRAGVTHQVISPVPVAMEHASTAPDGARYARDVNDSVAAACARSGGRLLGLGCLPSPGSRAAAVELERCRALGLYGVEIGTSVAGLDLDSPQLRSFWRECEATDSCVFVHPVAGGSGAVRRSGGIYDLGIGMTTDTALAAAALVFGGVLAAHPRLRIALAHGGGTFAAAFPRLEVAAGLAAGPDAPDHADLARLLYVDSLVFDDGLYPLLARRFGTRRLLLGSDAPFFPDQMRRSVLSVRSAVTGGLLPAAAVPAVLAENALSFLGLATAPGRASPEPESLAP